MKNIALTLALTFFLAACSSGGSTVAELPNNLTGVFNGTFESQNGGDTGTISFNIAQTQGATSLSGNVLVDGTGECLTNGVIDGASNISGFSVSITSTIELGSVTFQLTFDNANTLTGTYVATGCSNATGAGTITLTR